MYKFVGSNVQLQDGKVILVAYYTEEDTPLQQVIEKILEDANTVNGTLVAGGSIPMPSSDGNSTQQTNPDTPPRGEIHQWSTYLGESSLIVPIRKENTNKDVAGSVGDFTWAVALYPEPTTEGDNIKFGQYPRTVAYLNTEDDLAAFEEYFGQSFFDYFGIDADDPEADAAKWREEAPMRKKLNLRGAYWHQLDEPVQFWGKRKVVQADESYTPSHPKFVKYEPGNKTQFYFRGWGHDDAEKIVDPWLQQNIMK